MSTTDRSHRRTSTPGTRKPAALTGRIFFRLDGATRRAAQLVAATRGETLSGFVRGVIERAIEQS